MRSHSWNRLLGITHPKENTKFLPIREDGVKQRPIVCESVCRMPRFWRGKKHLETSWVIASVGVSGTEIKF